MRIAVAVAAIAAVSVHSAAAQERGWLAIGTDSASHAFSFRGADDAVNACGFADCEMVETFTACLAVAHSTETSSGRPVWTWTEAATRGDARRGARDECIASGGLACAVMNAYCADGASAAAQQALPAATPELEALFWQSIMNSTNPADFEAYLSQFPNGVFRALAENRLTQLQAPDGPRADASAAGAVASGRAVPGSRDASGADASPQSDASFRPDATCAGQPAGAACWMEIAQQPGCHVWNPSLQTNESVTWTGQCGGGFAQGTGTLTWFFDQGPATSTGRLVDGRFSGHWVVRYAHGTVGEGPYVDGERNGHWVFRQADGTVGEGPYVDGAQNGHWVFREADGSVSEGPYVDGAQNGHWVFRQADGIVSEGPVVDGERSGRWVRRWEDGSVEEGPYVDGERNGHWVNHWEPEGIVSEGPYIDGERNGRWVIRRADGTVEERLYRDGERVR